MTATPTATKTTITASIPTPTITTQTITTPGLQQEHFLLSKLLHVHNKKTQNLMTNTLLVILPPKAIKHQYFRVWSVTITSSPNCYRRFLYLQIYRLKLFRTPKDSNTIISNQFFMEFLTHFTHDLRNCNHSFFVPNIVPDFCKVTQNSNAFHVLEAL